MITRQRAWIATAVIIALSAFAEIVFRHSAHPVFFWHRVPLFDFVYGTSGCVLIVLASKWLGKAFIQRDENYYDDEGAP